MLLPDLIRSRRSELGLTQAELALRVGAESVYQSRISDWEAGRARPGLRQVIALAEALGAPVEEWAASWVADELQPPPAA